MKESFYDGDCGGEGRGRTKKWRRGLCYTGAREKLMKTESNNKLRNHVIGARGDEMTIWPLTFVVNIFSEN